MRKILMVIALAFAAAFSSIAIAPAASAAPIPPCSVKDIPDYAFDGRKLDVDLRTEIVCFDTPVVVG